MKKLEINILEQYKSYKSNTKYSLEGDLIILSGINGSGKSQLLNIIAQNGKEKINRSISQINENGVRLSLKNIILLSFRDNISLGNEFGKFSVNYRDTYVLKACDFYEKNIKHKNNALLDKHRTEKFNKGSLIYDSNGIKITSWRSVNKLIDLIKSNYTGNDIFHLSQFEIEQLLPPDYIWRNENDIIQQVGNLFYIACCKRVDKQIECSKTSEIFNNTEWLKTAPWTILNQLFVDLNFKYRFKTTMYLILQIWKKTQDYEMIRKYVVYWI